MTQLSDEVVERVARAIDPEAWQRRGDLLKFKQEPPLGIPVERHNASCERLACAAVERSIHQARAAIAAYEAKGDIPVDEG